LGTINLKEKRIYYERNNSVYWNSYFQAKG
jgi:hypothetical protein